MSSSDQTPQPPTPSEPSPELLAAIRALRLQLLIADTASQRQGLGNGLGRLLDRVGQLRIVIHPREHGVPHFHVEVRNGQDAAVYRIDTLERLEGKLPPKFERAVKQWGRTHQALLQSTWDSTRPTDAFC